MRRDNKKNYAAVSGYLSEEGDEFQFVIQTEDGRRLTRQMIIDVIGDYLIQDPTGLFDGEK